MKKRIAEYTSDKVLPDEIINAVDDFSTRIFEYRNEPDKLMCALGEMKYRIIIWFANNSKESPNE